MFERKPTQPKQLRKKYGDKARDLKARNLVVSGPDTLPNRPVKMTENVFTTQRADQHALPAYLIALGFAFLMGREILILTGSPFDKTLSFLVFAGLLLILFVFAFLQNQITKMNAHEINYYDRLRSQELPESEVDPDRWKWSENDVQWA